MDMSVCVHMDAEVSDVSVWVLDEAARILGTGSVCIVDVLIKGEGSYCVQASAYSRLSVKGNDPILLALFKPRCTTGR